MPSRHSTWALAALVAAAVLAGPAAAQQAQPRRTGYTIFLRGTYIGHEDVSVTSDASGTVISSEARIAVPQNTLIRKAEARYGPDWTPLSFTLDASVNGGPVTVNTAFADGVARTEGVQVSTPFTREHQVGPQAMVLLPASFFGAWEALTRRVTEAAGPVDLRSYVVPQGEMIVKVAAVVHERMQLANEFLDVRRYDIALQTVPSAVQASITATTDGRLIRLSIPAQGFDVVRDDVASSTSRTQIFTNPGDEAATIPAAGFRLGATLTRPKTGPARMPVAVLLAGSGIGDRDGTVAGVATLAQLAGRLAEAGIMAVRYDKRGYGQSGGRSESATLSDYAEDARAVVRWLAARKDVDPKRIALVGHSEGAWVGMIAAGREGRVAALVTLAGPSSTGTELILEQQQAALNLLDLTPADREERVALQRQIHDAVLNGRGWEGVPPAMRQQADTPWFQSVLQFDPSKSIRSVKQPLLVVHGALDAQVPPAQAERLAALAKDRSRSKSVELVVVPGVNHLLTPAATGAVAEYSTLTDRNVSAEVSAAVTGWLTRTFQAVK